jgi:Transposase and inactivated derivatives
MKYLVIYHRRDKYPIQAMCQFFGVSRSGYYSFVKRKEKVDRDEPLALLIGECQHKKHHTYGYRRVHIWLERRGIHHDPKTVLRVMNKYGLLSEIRRRKKYRIMSQQLHRYENILNRDFTADHPNQKIVTDITQFRYQNINYHFVCYLDLFNNEILEWNVSETEKMDLILPPLRRLLKRKKMSIDTPLLMHSDQGSQYSSAGYVNLLKQYNVIQSMSRAGTPHDNAVIESVFGWFKDFLRHEYLKKSTENIISVLTKAIYEFNTFRPSHKLNYISPVQYRLEQS